MDNAQQAAPVQRDRFETFRPLLDFIYSGEGGYTASNRGTERVDGRQRIIGSTQQTTRSVGGQNLSLDQMTIGQIMQFQSLPRDDPNRLFAVGAPQIIPGTMIQILPALRAEGINENTVFTPEVQDRIAVQLMISKQPALGDYLMGRSDDIDAAMDAFAAEWASVPNRITGRSNYENSGNSARHTVEEVRDALIQARIGFNGMAAGAQLQQPTMLPQSPVAAEQFTTPAGLAVPLVTGLEAPQFPAPRRPRRPRRGAAEAAPNALAQGQESPGRQQPQSEPGRPRVRQALTNFFNRFFGDESAAQTGQLPSMANFQPSENPVPAGPPMQPAAPMEPSPMPASRTPYSSSVFAPVATPQRPTPSYAMGGFVGPGGQPIMPAGLSTQTAPPEVGMDVTPEQIDQTVNQTMQANPQMVQQVQQLIMESVQSGETTMEELNTLGQMAQAALQDPNLYPQLRQLAIREGLATQEDIPPQFDPALITVMLVAVRAVKDATAQQPPTPQPIQSMAMGGAVVPISKKQSIDPRHDEPVIAELEKGEYVIPKNVVEMKGREFFDSLIAKYDPANAKGAKS